MCFLNRDQQQKQTILRANEATEHYIRKRNTQCPIHGPKSKSIFLILPNQRINIRNKPPPPHIRHMISIFTQAKSSP